MMKPGIVFLLCLLLLQHSVVKAQKPISYYIPNPVQIPALSGEGEGSVRGGWSWAGAFNGYNLMGIYSPMRHVAVIVNHNGRNMKDIKAGEVPGTNFSLTEAGAGMYYNIKRHSFSCLAGYGREKLFSNYKSSFSETSTVWLRRYFLQASYAVTGPKTVIGIGLRMIHMKHDKALISLDIDTEYLRSLETIEGKTPFLFPEWDFQVSIVRYYPVSVSMHIATAFPNWSELKLEPTSVGMCIGYGFGSKKAVLHP